MACHPTACLYPADMGQLLLLRHAKSSWDDPDLADHARPLNLRGQQAAKAMALAMRQFGLQPDHVMVSSARRTLQTLAALDLWQRPPVVEPMDALYLADAEDMLDLLREIPAAADSVLLVGHNPGLHLLAMMLAGAGAARVDKQVQRMASGFPSGALAQFGVASPWRELCEGGGRLLRFVLPSDLSTKDLSEANA